jgi:dephospho-CoA kinase
MHPSSIKHPRIAFVGYSRVGKTTAALALRDIGFVHRDLSDVVKEQLDTLLQRHLNISAFTEVEVEKMVIRPILEAWGKVNRAAIDKAYFAQLPKRCVCSRLYYPAQAQAWRLLGGLVVELVRSDVVPASIWEVAALSDLEKAELITHRLTNDGTPEELAAKVVALARGEL